jgi:flagella basal body P-ring formation protein FlgA
MKRFLIIITCLIELTAFLDLHAAAADSAPSILIELNEWLTEIDGENIAFVANDLRGPITRKECDKPIHFYFTNASRRVIKADCKGQWRRFIKVPERIHLAKISTDLIPSRQHDLNAYVLTTNVSKGLKITEDMLDSIRSSRSIPTNAFTEISQLDDLYLQRDKKRGDILISEDLDTSKIVVVPMVILPSGSPLDTNTLIEITKFSDVPADYISSIASLRYMELSKTVGVGEIVRTRHLRKARLMRRNESVTIYSISNNFSIETKAIALSDGYLGERIEVKNPESNKIITARVVGYGLLSLN